MTTQAGNEAGHRWLPQFCSLPTLFAVMVVAELVVIVLALAPALLREAIAGLGLATVSCNGWPCLNVVVLCSMRDTFARWPARTGFVVAWLLAVVTTGLGSAVVHAMDAALGLRLLDDRGGAWRFAIGNAAICALIAAALLRYLYVRELWQERACVGGQGPGRCLAGAHPPAFPLQQHEHDRQPHPHAAGRGRAHRGDLSDLFRAALGAREAARRSARNSTWSATPAHRGAAARQRLKGRQPHRSVAAFARPAAAAAPQPLVENAVYHGIQRLPDGGTVVIEGIHHGDAVEIIVRNPCPVDDAKPGNTHALANVRCRIGYHFGARARAACGAGARRVRGARAPACRETMKVLLVDDEPLARERLAALLADAGGIGGGRRSRRRFRRRWPPWSD